MRLITNTYCECTRDARYKSEVKDLYPEKKSPKLASKTRQKKMSELDPFFNDEALVKGIAKDSKRLRSGGTVCVMPKYVSAIVNKLVYYGTKSPLGMFNGKPCFRLKCLRNTNRRPCHLHLHIHQQSNYRRRTYSF